MGGTLEEEKEAYRHSPGTITREKLESVEVTESMTRLKKREISKNEEKEELEKVEPPVTPSGLVDAYMLENISEDEDNLLDEVDIAVNSGSGRGDKDRQLSSYPRGKDERCHGDRMDREGRVENKRGGRMQKRWNENEELEGNDKDTSRNIHEINSSSCVRKDASGSTVSGVLPHLVNKQRKSQDSQGAFDTQEINSSMIELSKPKMPRMDFKSPGKKVKWRLYSCFNFNSIAALCRFTSCKDAITSQTTLEPLEPTCNSATVQLGKDTHLEGGYTCVGESKGEKNDLDIHAIIPG